MLSTKTLIATKPVLTPSSVIEPTDNMTAIQPTKTVKESTLNIPICVSKSLPPSSLKDIPLIGKIIYQTYLNNRAFGLYTIDYASSDQGKLLTNENREIDVLGVSPDGEWLAYSPVLRGLDDEPVFDAPPIILLNMDGERIKHTLDIQQFSNHLNISHRWFSYGNSRWINNQFIITTLVGNQSDGTPGKLDFLSKILDPFHGTWEQKMMENVPDPFLSPQIDFAPDMSRVAYADVEGSKN